MVTHNAIIKDIIIEVRWTCTKCAIDNTSILNINDINPWWAQDSEYISMSGISVFGDFKCKGCGRRHDMELK